MKFTEDSFRKKKKHSRKKVVVGMGLLVIISLLGINSLITIFHQKRQISSLKQEIERITQKNNTLVKEITALKTNPSHIENVARQMGMMRQGEKKVKFVPKEKVESRE